MRRTSATLHKEATTSQIRKATATAAAAAAAAAVTTAVGHSITHSLTQPIDDPIRGHINDQPSNQPSNQLTKRPTNQPTSKSTSKSTSKQINQSTTQLTGAVAAGVPQIEWPKRSKRGFSSCTNRQTHKRQSRVSVSEDHITSTSWRHQPTASQLSTCLLYTSPSPRDRG